MEKAVASDGLWEQVRAHVPAGHLTLVVGHPGVGKSLVALEWACRAARRAGADGGGGMAIVSSAEDSSGEMMRRVEAGCVGMGRVVPLPSHLNLEPAPRKHSKDDGKSSLVQFLEETRTPMEMVRMVVLDPLPAFLGWKDGAGAMRVRRLMRPLLDLAEKWGFGVVGITHLRKGEGRGHVLHQALGSLAYTALARSVLLVRPDGNEVWDGRRVVASGRRLVVPVKNNLGQVGLGWAFRIKGTEKGPRVEWEEGRVEVEPEAGGVGEEAGVMPLEEAVAYLRARLGGGAAGSAEVQRGARAVGISGRTLERARRALGVVCAHDGVRGRWVMRLGEGGS